MVEDLIWKEGKASNILEDMFIKDKKLAWVSVNDEADQLPVQRVEKRNEKLFFVNCDQEVPEDLILVYRIGQRDDGNGLCKCPLSEEQVGLRTYFFVTFTSGKWSILANVYPETYTLGGVKFIHVEADFVNSALAFSQEYDLPMSDYIPLETGRYTYIRADTIVSIERCIDG